MPTFERSKLSVILSDLDTIYMVLKHRSRTGSKRHYQLLAVVEGEIEDVTPMVCKAIASSFDNIYGTFNSNCNYLSQDALHLHCEIRKKTKREVDVVVL